MKHTIKWTTRKVMKGQKTTAEVNKNKQTIGKSKLTWLSKYKVKGQHNQIDNKRDRESTENDY